MNRKAAATLGLETVSILDAGGYIVGDVRIDLATRLAAAVKRTREYGLDAAPDAASMRTPTTATTFEVTTESTLQACHRLSASCPAALVFGSARSPGGGFLMGARAQEESVARSSGLSSCLRERRLYEFHANRLDPFYSDWVIHSPDVPVFRDDDGNLLAEPYDVSFVTCPPVNAAAVMEHEPTRVPEIELAMTSRVHKLLGVFAAHGHRHLVLGAWGCGVFRNDPAIVSAIFRRALDSSFRGAFERVVFAVYDSADGPTVTAFRKAFDPRGGNQ